MFGVEWIAGFEPAQSAWKAEMLAIKHHTHIKKTIIFYSLSCLNNDSWCPVTESNRRPPACKADALTC